MNNYDLDNVFNNIKISDEMKKELYDNCRKGRRTADFRFRHAGVITALLITAILGCTGLGANAMYGGIKARMENMSEEERADYVYEIENDDSVTISGAYSRELTNDEILRAAELERKYNAQNLFPKEEVKRVASLSEWDGKSVCYVDEDNKVHFPEDTMTDEQLLQYIDYAAKKEYMIEQEVLAYEADEADEEEGTGNRTPYVDVSVATEQDIIDLGYTYLKDFLGGDLGEGWTARVEAFKPSTIDPELGTEHDMYTIYWEQIGGTSYSTDYVVVLNMDDLSFGAVAVRGKEHWATLGSYTREEALKIAEEIRPKVCRVLADEYGLPSHVKERHEAYDDYSDEDIRQIRFVFKTEDKTYDILWDISTEKLASIEIFDEE